MRFPCFARRWNSRKSGWIMGIGSRFRLSRNLRSTVFSSQKKRPIITLVEAGPVYSSEASGILEGAGLPPGEEQCQGYGEAEIPPAGREEKRRQAAALQSSKRDPSLPMVVQDRHPSSGVWLTITATPPYVFCKCCI